MQSSIARKIWSTAAARTSIASKSKTRWPRTRPYSKSPSWACPDEMMGEKVGAVIVLKPKTANDVADLLAFVQDADRRFQGSAVRLRPHRTLAEKPGWENFEETPP